jgi:phosphoribosylglycinamide formyltransferase-1
LLDAAARPGFPARIALVVSDREHAQALERARGAGVPALFVNPKDFGTREEHETAIQSALDGASVGLVCLAGYMRLLSPAFVRAWAGRIMNIHPSLLPAFPGLAAQRQALAHGVQVAGATVHFVDEGVDSGPIVAQACVPVVPEDTEETLADRILVQEHRLYPEAVRRFAEGRLRLAGRRVIVEDEP